jgi:bifunctional DNA-binding transcriptional regulator/antitoxin component of YhaV-PrlF toxin-antitoxin module
MQKQGTITSKRQITIPAEIYHRAELSGKRKVLISEKNGVVSIVAFDRLVDNLSGSLKIKPQWRGKTTDQIIKEARADYFRKQKL